MALLIENKMTTANIMQIGMLVVALISGWYSLRSAALPAPMKSNIKLIGANNAARRELCK
jgi:hypothetical protein